QSSGPRPPEGPPTALTGVFCRYVCFRSRVANRHSSTSATTCTSATNRCDRPSRHDPPAQTDTTVTGAPSRSEVFCLTATTVTSGPSGDVSIVAISDFRDSSVVRGHADQLVQPPTII